MHEQDTGCTHQITTVNDHGMVACGSCQTVDWFTPKGRADAHAGMSAAFGNFDQVTTLRGLDHTAPNVSLYAPASKSDQRALAALPVKIWLEVQPQFWVASDGSHLLISVDVEREAPALEVPPRLSVVPSLA